MPLGDSIRHAAELTLLRDRRNLEDEEAGLILGRRLAAVGGRDYCYSC